jgi:hypothetical protein
VLLPIWISDIYRSDKKIFTTEAQRAQRWRMIIEKIIDPKLLSFRPKHFGFAQYKLRTVPESLSSETWIPAFAGMTGELKQL